MPCDMDFQIITVRVMEHMHCAQLPHKQNTRTIEQNVRGNCTAPVGLKDVMKTVISCVNRM